MSKLVFFFGDGTAEGDPKRRDILGGKGAGLAEMTNLGLPVPPGLTISTEASNLYVASGKLPEGLEAQIDEALAKVEKSVGAKFGDADNPLLVSVRSGARASMPGMMDTILNLGLGDATARGLVKKTENPRFVFDAYRRFISMYASVAMGLKKEPFEHALEVARGKVAAAKGIAPASLNAEELKKRVPDSEIPADALIALVAEYKALVKQLSGQDFPEDAKTQLIGAIVAVFRSWNNQRAIFYRRMHDIPDSWGTACNVQAMVFGNLGESSATGVAFTRDPSTGEKLIFGEWLPNAQGEDVVAGIRTPNPIREALASAESTSLEKGMPLAYAELLAISGKLEKHFRDMQDLEFTIQNGKLYMLQCRNGKRAARASVRIAVEMVKEGLISKEEAVLRVEASSLDQLLHPTLDPNAPKKDLAHGLAASPGAASGHVVFNADDAERLASDKYPVILVRIETSPEDIHGMKAAKGILTARGGMTSHAAVVARGMGTPCVAGASAVAIDYDKQQMTVSVYDAAGAAKEAIVVKAGDRVTLDGGTGAVYLGAVATVPASLTGEFGELMKWADEHRKMGVRANADAPNDAKVARNFGAEGIGLCRTEHMFFEADRIAAVREMILADTKEQRRTALAKLLPFQRTDFVGIFREMQGLPVTIRLLDPPLHEFLPTTDEQIEELAKTMGVSAERLRQRTTDLHEFNPMLGHRGVRLAITYPEIYEIQIRAILEAAAIAAKENLSVLPEIMIPLSLSKAELTQMRAMVDRVASEVFGTGARVPFLFGTMIELPRAALRAAELAEEAEFFSFGTNDLTQCTMGLSRDDAGKFLPAYVESGILPKDPFVSLDQEGVGELVKLAAARGKTTRPNIKVGICGEHGGDPASVEFFYQAGLNYVSCSPYRVPIARLAAAQAALRGQNASAKASSTA